MLAHVGPLTSQGGSQPCCWQECVQPQAAGQLLVLQLLMLVPFGDSYRW
jgi:hypothetical protein